MSKKNYEKDIERLEHDLEVLRSSSFIDSFMISLLTMKAFYPETWFKSYDVQALLDALDYHIERLQKTNNGIATPVGLGAIDIIYHDHVDGQPWPTYEEIFVNLKNDIIMRWDGAPVKRKTFDDIEREQEEAEAKWLEEKNKN